MGKLTFDIHNMKLSKLPTMKVQLCYNANQGYNCNYIAISSMASRTYMRKARAITRERNALYHIS